MPIEMRDLDQASQVKLDNLCAALSGIMSADKIQIIKNRGCPLIEDIEGDPDHKRVTFFFNDESKKCASINLCSKFFYLDSLHITQGKIAAQKMSFEGSIYKIPYLIMDKIATTKHGDVYATTVDLPKEACFSYNFKFKTASEPETQIIDPLSQQVYTVIQWGIPHLEFGIDPVVSVIDLSPLPNTSEHSMAAIKQEGRLLRYAISDTGNLKVIDDNYEPQENERTLDVHLPQGYNQNTTYKMRLFLDGPMYFLNEAPAQLDNDVSTVNIMLEPKKVSQDLGKNREQEYLPKQDLKTFAALLTKILIPNLHQEFHISSLPSDNTICGASYSGFTAIYIGLYYPQVFGKVLAQSAALYVDKQCLLQQLATGEINIDQLKLANFYLVVGKGEKYQLDEIENNKEKLAEDVGVYRSVHNFVDTMVKSGISCKLKVRCTGHEVLAWHKFLPEACLYLDQPTSDRV